MKKYLQKISKKPMIIMSIVIAVIAILAISITFAAEEVKVSVLQTPKIDIALAKSRTSVDLSNFKQDLLNALDKKGVDSSKVNIIDVESTEANIQTSFTWNQNVSGSIGSINIANNGRNVIMYGNPSNAGKNAIWIMTDTNGDEKFTFDYSINFGDSFNAAGMLLNVRQTNASMLEGYMLSFNNRTWNASCGGYNGAIWKFTYYLNTNGTPFSSPSTIQLVQGLNIASSGTLSVTASDGLIEITGGGLTNQKVKLPTIYGKGFGFFSDHYSHGCQNIGNFNLTNIKLDIINYKKISQTLREPNWRENALRLMVNVDDYAYENFDEDSYLSEIITRATNDDLYYVAWGTDANKVDAQKLINSIGDKGSYINNTNYKTAIDDTAQYIYELLGGRDIGNTFCLGDDIELNVSPEDIKTNTADANWPGGRWRVDHQYDYYENNNGQYAQTGIYTSDLNINFDKVGKYVITYEDKNIVPTEIFVHRKPVASFNIKRTGNIFEEGTENLIGNTIELESTSYDLDKLSDNDGIQEEEWSYKAVNDSGWTQGKIQSVRNDTTYLVRLRVKDFQDKWSDYETKYISADSANPIASFSIKNPQFTLYEQLQIVDNSYDPSGKDLKSHTWKVTKDKSPVYVDSTPLLDYKSLGKGEYTIELVVTNADGASSEAYSQKFTVIDDEIAPEVIADPVSDSVTNKAINVHLSFTDQGGSGFQYFKYAVSDTQNATDSDLDWSGKLRSNEYDIKVSEVGDNYIYVKAVDNAENESAIRILGDYCIEQTTFNINLQLTDFDNPNILLGDAKFTLIQPKKGIFDERKTIDGITDAQGKITFNAQAMDAGTYDYILYETEAPTDYESIALGAVRITFDKDGNISKVEKVIYSSDLLEIKDDYSATEMNLDIKNKTLQSAEEDKKENFATLNFSLVDSKDSNLPVDGAIYTVTTESNDKNWTMTNILTDEYGKISIPIQGEGNIRVTISQQQPKAGYAADSQDEVIILNVKNGVIQYLISKEPNTLLSTISQADNSVNVSLTAVKKDIDNEIKLKLVDSEEINTAINGVDFLMVLPDGATKTATTDVDGFATFTNIPQSYGNDTKIFTFKQKGDAFSFLPAEDASVKVTFTDGLITGVEDADSDNIIETNATTEEDEEKISNVAIVTLGLTSDPDVAKYSFVLALEEKDSENVVAGAKYKITVENGENLKQSIGTTNKSGEIKVSVPVSDDVRISVEELVSAVGYVATAGKQEIQLNKNEKGQLEVLNYNNVKEPPYINQDNKIIKLFDYNEKRNISNASKLSIFVTKVDEYNSKVQNLKVKVSGTLLDEPQFLVTDKSGRVSVKALEPKTEGNYDFVITEMNSDKTENTDSTIKIRIKYQYLEGYLQVTGIQVLQGNKFVKEKQYANYQSVDNYQSDVKVTSFAKGEVDIEDSNKLGITSVDFTKTDAKGLPLDGAEYALNVTRPDGTVLSRDGIQISNDENSIELPAVYIPDGSLVEINETKAPIGYSIDKNTAGYLVEIDPETNEMKLTPSSGASNAKEKVSSTELADGRTRYAMEFTVSDSVLAPTYKFNVQKSTENDTFSSVTPTKYNVIVKENGVQQVNKDYETDATGSISVSDLNGVGTLDMFVNEENEPAIKLQVERQLEDDKYTFKVTQDPSTDPTNLTITRKISVETDDANQIITLKIVDSTNLKFNVKNVDYRENLPVNGVAYRVTLDELDAGGNVKNSTEKFTDQSDSEGNIELKVYKKFVGETVRVTLHAEKLPADFDPTEDIVFTLKYSASGSIISYKTTNDKSVAEITNNPVADQGVALTITHKKLDGLQLGITAMDVLTESDYVSGATFTITEDNKNTTVMTGATSADGLTSKVVGTRLYGKTVTYTIKNVSAGPEYKQLTEDIVFTMSYTNDGDIDLKSLNIVQGADICELTKTLTGETANDLELTIKFTPKDKFFVEYETVDYSSGEHVPNAPVTINNSFGKSAKDISKTDTNSSVNVGYVVEGLNVNYTVKVDSFNDKYMPVAGEQFTVTFDKDGYVAQDGYKTSSKLVSFKDEDYAGKRVVKIIIKLIPKLSLEIDTVDAFNSDIKIANSKFEVAGSQNLSAKMTTDENGQAIGYISPFELGTAVQYTIAESQSNEKYYPAANSKLFINFDSNGNIMGIPTISGAKNAKVEVVGQGSKSVPNIKVTIPNEQKVKFTIDNIEAGSGGILALVGKINISNDKTGESAQFTSDGIAAVGAFGINETITYTVSQTNVPKGFSGFNPFKIRVTFDNTGKITQVIKDDANNNNIIVNRQDSNIGSNKWYTGNDRGAVEIKTKSYPMLRFNIKSLCGADNKAIDDLIYTITSTEDLSVETEKSDAQGNIVIFAGDTKEGSIVYTIKQKTPALGYRDLGSEIQISVKYGSDGYIVAETKNPRVTFGNESAKIVSTSNTSIDLNIEYESLDSSALGLECIDAFKQDKKLNGIGYTISKVKLGNYSNILESQNLGTITSNDYGLSSIDLGKYKSETVVFRAQQTTTASNYETQLTPLMFSLTYDENGKIVGSPVMLDGKAYLEIQKCTDYYVKFVSKHYPKITVSMNSHDRFDTDKYLSTACTITDYYYDSSSNYNGYVGASDTFTVRTTGTPMDVSKNMGGVRANQTRTYWLSGESAPAGYQFLNDYMGFSTGYPRDSYSGPRVMLGAVYVTYGANGEIVKTSSSDPKCIYAEIIDDTHIKITTTYTKLFTLTVNLKDDVTKGNVSRTFSLSPRARQTYWGVNGSNTYTWSSMSGGGYSLNARSGETTQNGVLSYFLSEYMPDKRYINKGGIGLYVYYDDIGNIQAIKDSTGKDLNDPAKGISTSFTGTHATLNLDYSTEYKMKIAASDLYDSSKSISAYYKVTSSKGDSVTISNNVEFSIGKKYGSETVTYEITQIQVSDGYILNSDPMFIDVSFMPNGTQVVSTRGNSNIDKDIQITNNGALELGFTVYNKQRLGMNLHVNDDLYTSDNIIGAKFRVTSDRGEEAINSVITDSFGNASLIIGQVYQNDIVNYSIKQLNTIPGYYSNDKTINVKVVYDGKGNVIENTIVQGEDIAKIVGIPNGRRDVSISLTNHVKDINFGIETTNKLSGATIANVGYKITKTIADNNNDFVVISDNSGEALANVDEYNGKKDVIYTVEQTSIPGQYSKLADPIKFKVSYDENSRPVTMTALTEIPDNITIKIPKESRPTFAKSGARVDVLVSVKADDSHSIKFVDVDNRVPTAAVEGSKFKCTVSADSAENPVTYSEITTNGDGIAKYMNLVENGKINIHFEQTGVGDGYKENLNNQGDITLEKDNNTIQIVNTNIQNNVKAELDPETRQLIITVQNETELKLDVLRNDGAKMLQGSKMDILEKEIDENDTVVNTKTIATNVVTGEDGKLEYVLGNSPISKKYQYQFIEKESPAGYDVLDPILITVDYDANGMIKKISSNSPAATCTKTGKLHLVTAINSGLGDVGYKINFKTLDEETKKGINGSVITASLSNVDGTNIAAVTSGAYTTQDVTVGDDSVIESGVASISNIISEGNLKLTFKETSRAIGYLTLDENIPEYSVQFKSEYIKVDDGNKADVKLTLGESTQDLDVSLDQDGKTINIVLLNKANPAYSVRVISVDQDDDSIRKANQNLTVDITNALGKDLTKQATVKTDGNGEAKVEDINGLGDIDIKITQDDIPGLEAAEAKLYRDPDKKLITMNTQKGVRCEVDNKNCEIKVYLLNKQQEGEYSIVLNNIGETDETIKEQFDYVITDPKGTAKVYSSQSNGILIMPKLQVPQEPETQDFKVTLQQAPEFCTLPEEGISFTVHVKFDYNDKGIMVPAETTVDGSDTVAVAEDSTEQLVKLNVKFEASSTYSIKFISVDSEDKDIRSSNQKYSIKVSNEFGEDISVEKDIETDQNGEFLLEDISGYGKVTITATEKDKLEPLTVTMDLSIDPITRIIKAPAAQGVDYDIDNSERIVTLSILSKQSEGDYSIAINNISKNDRPILDEFTYEVTSPSGKTEEVTTDENGVLVLKGLEMPSKAQTSDYTFKCIEKPEICDPDEELEFKLSIIFDYDEDDYLGIFQAETDNPDNVEITKVRSQLVKANAKFTADDTLPAYNVKIVNVDENDVDYRISGTKMDVTIESEFGEESKTISEETSELGEININNMNGYGNITITVAQEGVTDPDVIKLKRNELTGIITNDSANSDFDISPDQTQVTLFIVARPKDGKYSVVFNNMDVNSKKVIEDIFEYELIDENGEKQILTSDDKGRIELRDLDLPETAGTKTYMVRPLCVPTEYVLNSKDSIQLDVTFDEVDGDIEIVSASLKNDETAKIEKQTAQFVKVNIMNTTDPNAFAKYAIIINKVDATTKDNIAGVTELELTLPDGSVENYKTDEDGVLELLDIAKPKKEGTYLYRIREITPPDGYKLLEDPQVLAVTFEKDITTGEINLKDTLIVTGNNVEVNKAQNSNVIQLNLMNSNDSTFSVQVINGDKDDSDFRIPGTEFNITVTGDEEEKNVDITDKTGLDGAITVDNISAYGNVVVNIHETKDRINGCINLKRDPVTGLITSGSSSDLDYNIDNDKHIVYVYVLDAQQEKNYTIVFGNVNSVTKENITDVFEYEVTGPDGKTTSVQTSANGRLELTELPMPETTCIVKYTLKPVYIPKEYRFMDNDIELALGFDEVDGKMGIVSADVKKGTSAVVDKFTKQVVKVNIFNDPEDSYSLGKYSILMNNKCNTDNILDEMSYDITSPDGETTRYTTDEDGEIRLLNLERPHEEGTYSYKIQQISSAEGYEEVEDEQVLDITFAIVNNEMKITDKKVSSGKNLNISKDSTDKVVKVDFLNSKVKVPFSIKLINVDVDDYDFTIPDKEFDIKLTSDDGTSKSAKAKTNASGAINIKDIMAYGTINVDVKQTDAEVGGSISLIRNEDSNIITVDSASNVDYNVDNFNNVVYVYILNYQPTENYTVVFANVDKDSKNLVRDSFEYEITSEDDTKTYASNANGRIELSELIMPEQPGTVEYTLKPTYIPIGYVCTDEEIKISVEFDKVDNRMQIVGTNILEGDSVEIEKSTAQLVKVNILNQIDINNENYALLIRNKYNDSILSDPMSFDITSPDGNVKRYTTNEDGEIRLLNLAKPAKEGKYYYKIKQVNSLDGLEPVNDEQELELTFGMINDVLEVIDKKVTSGNNLVVNNDSTNKVVKLDFVNHKTKLPFSMKIINVDVDDYDFTIPNKEFDITLNSDDGTTKSAKATTNASGAISIPDIMAYGNISVDIKQTDSKVGGNISLQRNPDTDVITVDSATDLDYVLDNDKNIVYVYVLNYQQKENYTMVFANVDSESHELVRDIFEYEITCDDKTSTYTSNANGRVELSELEMPDAPGVVEYTVTPIYIPTGYIFSKTSIKVSVKFDRVDGEMKIIGADVLEGNNAVIEKTTNQLVKVNIANRIDVENPYSAGKYALVINNKYGATNTNIVQHTKYEVTSPDGTIESYDTNANGRVELLNITKPDKVGTYYYIIKQIETPEGFLPAEEEQKLAITFDIVDNKVVIVNKTVESGTNLVIEPTKNANVLQLDFLNNKDASGDLFLKTDGFGYEIVNNDGEYVGNKGEFEGGDVYLNRITDKTTVNDFISKLNTNASKVVIKNQKGEEVTGDQYVGTGMTMTLTQEGSDKTIELMLVVTGDLTGNGKVGIVDTSRIESHYLKIKTIDQISDNEQLVNAYMKAADINNNGKITIVDTSKMSSYYLKLTNVLYK